jgi:acetyl-CoA C-acetyltransferase
MMKAFVLDIIRTPIGRYGGALSSVRPDDLAALTIQKLISRNAQLNTAEIEDVIIGAANQAGEDNRNVARMALLLAGLPDNVAGQTVNRLCASGLQAIIDGAQSLSSGNGNLIIAGGVESMSRAPFVVAKASQPFSRNIEMFDTTMGWRFINEKLSRLYYPFNMGETAENVAVNYKISRENQDRFALQSQERYAAAASSHKFDDELVEVQAGKNLITTDEHPRQTSLEKLSALAPVFKSNGTVTAGNSSGINDGAAACLMVSEEYLKTATLTPIARVVSVAVAGVNPSEMGVGPVPATRKALARAGLNLNDIGLIELNEAFASQSLACIQLLGIDPSIVNVNGGAIALGHPLGCSGVRISATLLHEMKRRKIRYGLATMCVGVGQGVAVIYENTSI